MGKRQTAVERAIAALDAKRTALLDDANVRAAGLADAINELRKGAAEARRKPAKGKPVEARPVVRGGPVAREASMVSQSLADA